MSLREDFFVDFFTHADHGIDDLVGFEGRGHGFAPMNGGVYAIGAVEGQTGRGGLWPVGA